MNRFALALITAIAAGELAAAKTPVVVIGVDKKTQQALGPFGGSYRAHHAKLIEKLNAAGVKGITFAFTFVDNPKHKAGTKALADAAKASAAPVTITAEITKTKHGWLEERSASELQDPRISQGHAVLRPELLTGTFGAWGKTKEGEIGVLSEAMGYRSLAETTMLRTTPLQAGDVDRLGLAEDVQTGKDLFGKSYTSKLIRPKLDKKPLTLSYIDVLRKGPHPKLKGAIVLIGINDGEHDQHENPTPAVPEIKRVSGVYLHAALLQRLLKEVPRRLKEEAARAKQGVAGAPQSAGGKLGLIQKLDPAKKN